MSRTLRPPASRCRVTQRDDASGTGVAMRREARERAPEYCLARTGDHAVSSARNHRGASSLTEVGSLTTRGSGASSAPRGPNVIPDASCPSGTDRSPLLSRGTYGITSGNSAGRRLIGGIAAFCGQSIPRSLFKACTASSAVQVLGKTRLNPIALNRRSISGQFFSNSRGAATVPPTYKMT